MRRLLLACAVLGLVGTIAPATTLGAPEAPPDDSIAARVDRYLAARVALGRFSGAALVARGDRVLVRRGYGFADVERRTPYTPETLHPIASVSKMFTAMAALELADRGRLSLSDSLANRLPDCPPQWKAITVDHLLHHASGIPDYEDSLGLGSERYFDRMRRPDSAREILAWARALPLSFPPGTAFHYSNTGYIVLGTIVERAAGVPFARFLEEDILRPAGLEHTHAFDGVRVPDGLDAGYSHPSLPWPRMLAGAALTDGHLVRQPFLPFGPPHGDGGLFSTPDDLLRWSRAMDGKGPWTPQRIATATHPQRAGYAAGWFVDEALGRRRLRHNGILPGALTDFAKYPEDSLTVVLFSNLDRARLDKIARDVAAIALGLGWDLPVQGSVVDLTPSQTAPLEGEYRMEDGATLVVRREPDMLTAGIEGRFTAGLIPLSPTEFYFPLGDGRAVFTLDAAGRGATVNLRYAGEDHRGTR